MDGSPAVVSAVDASIAPPAKRRAWTRWLVSGAMMGAAAVATDVALELVNQSTGLVSGLRPWSFLAGPAVGILVGRLAGLRRRGDWVRAAVVGVVTWLVVGTFFVGLALSSGPSAPSLQTVDVGTGGTDCAVLHSGRSFAVGDEVRASAEFRPPIAAGSTVTIRLTRDGTPVDGYPVVQVADSDWDCVYGTASLTHDALPAGHYRWEIEYTGSAMPPVGADFEVR